MVINKKFLVVSCCLLALVVTSCNRGPKMPEGMPKPVPCEIKVEYEDGGVVEKASVVLSPAEGSSSKWGASGDTDASGLAVVKTDGQFPGAVPGKYKVLISRVDYTLKGTSPDGMETHDSKVIIDPSFGDMKKSPHSIEVGNEKITQTFKVKKAK